MRFKPRVRPPPPQLQLIKDLGDVQSQLQALQVQNEELNVRATVLSLLLRCSDEVAAHRRAHGAAADNDDGRDLAGLAEAERQLQAVGCGPGGAAAATPIEERLEHLRPGCSLLGLERCVRGRLLGSRMRFSV